MFTVARFVIVLIALVAGGLVGIREYRNACGPKPAAEEGHGQERASEAGAHPSGGFLSEVCEEGLVTVLKEKVGLAKTSTPEKSKEPDKPAAHQHADNGEHSDKPDHDKGETGKSKTDHAEPKKTSPPVTPKKDDGGAGHENGKAEAEQKGSGHKHGEGEESEGLVKLTAEQTKLVELKTATVKSAPISVDLIINAEVTANQDKIGQVLAKTSGAISSVQKHLGDRVKAGETLVVIASRELAEAEATYTKAKAKADFAKAQLAREETLRKQKVTSEQDYQSARESGNESNAELAAAEQKLKLLESNHTNTPEHKNQQSAGVPVTAPFDGTIIEKKVALGDQVTDQSALFKIADLDTVWVIANVFEKDLEHVAVGQAASVSVRAHPDKVFEGPVTWVAAVLDEKTRTMQARIEIENKDGHLKPGSFATVTLKVVTKADGLSVPPSAIQRQKSDSIVFVQTADGVYKRREVKIGDTSHDAVEVLEGLKAGEIVVTNGSFILKSELEKSSFAEE